MKTLTLFFFTSAWAISVYAISIDTVPIANSGNAADSTGFGSVSYDFRIGKYEVTNLQYTAFLNSVAASDPLELYNDNMGGLPSFRGGIIRSGVDGSFSYAAKENMANKPVNFVSWYDAARFINWLDNGQPTGPEGNGTTETGAYTLLGGTVVPSNGLPARNPGAKWFLPNENEWYKAAYYDPALGGYWSFPTGSNGPTIKATANATGDISNPGPNVMNYDSGANWNGQTGNLTTVGSAGPSSASDYGTFDQGGNVFEMIQAALGFGRGGAWNFGQSFLNKSTNDIFSMSGSSNFLGFRVGAAIPEPSALLLLSVTSLMFALRRRLTSHNRV